MYLKEVPAAKHGRVTKLTTNYVASGNFSIAHKDSKLFIATILKSNVNGSFQMASLAATRYLAAT
jgi:hypothetical protein